MKSLLKLLFISVIALALISTAAYLFLVFKGKDLVVKQIENITHKEVSIGSLNVSPPFNIEIKNLNIAGLINADYVSISPSLFSFFSGNITFDYVKVVRPEFTYEKRATQDKTEGAEFSLMGILPIRVPGLMSSSKPSEPQIKPLLQKKKPLRLILKRVRIENGTLNIIDHTAGEGGIKFTIKDLNLNLKNLYFVPRSAVADFELKGIIPWNGDSETGKVEMQGWLNLFKKDMRASVEIKGIDGIALYPYYARWVDLEKTRIQKAKLNFSSNIRSLNNNLIAECHLELTDIVRRPLAAEEQEDKAAKIANTVLTIFQALTQGKVVFDFTIRTRMDMPELGFADIKNTFEAKLAEGRRATSLKPEDIVKTPAHILKGTVKGATDISKAVFDGTFALAKELKEAIKVSFKREKDTD